MKVEEKKVPMGKKIDLGYNVWKSGFLEKGFFLVPFFITLILITNKQTLLRVFIEYVMEHLL